MTIDWDGIAQEAEDSPRGLLAELLARADEIEEIVIVFLTTDANGAECTNTWQNTRHQSMTIALLEYAKWHQMYQMHGAAGRPD